MDIAPSDVVVFDIGGVLVKLGGMAKFVKWTGQTPDQIKSRWLSFDAVKEFESGRRSFRLFASAVIEEFGLPIGADELRHEMQSWMGEIFDGAQEIVAMTRTQRRVACLCNANEIQWPRVRDDLGLGQWFSHQFVSHEIGLVKPDPEIYRHVERELGVSPGQISFFDDSMPNVEGATRAGWNAYHVRRTEELRNRLSALDYLSAGPIRPPTAT
jgi:HAD superfamily hydrolase (TIGR01493 family)